MAVPCSMDVSVSRAGHETAEEGLEATGLLHTLGLLAALVSLLAKRAVLCSEVVLEISAFVFAHAQGKARPS